MISIRALGVLHEVVFNGTNISADSLAQKFGENRKRFLKDLKELRDAGLIETHKERIGRCWMTVSTVTEAGREYAVGSPHMGLLISQNSNKYLYSYSDINKPTRPAEPVEEEFSKINLEVKGVGYSFFEKTSSGETDDRIEERAKSRAKKKADYEARALAKQGKKFTSRYDMAKSDWSSADVGFEFADRVHKYFHIKPWSLTASKFVPALSNMRLKHDTDGEVEYRMLDLFFESIIVDNYDDAEHLWRLFIKRFPEFVMPAKRSIIPSEPSEDQKAWHEKSLSKLRADV